MDLLKREVCSQIKNGFSTFPAKVKGRDGMKYQLEIAEQISKEAATTENDIREYV